MNVNNEFCSKIQLKPCVLFDMTKIETYPIQIPSIEPEPFQAPNEWKVI